MRKFCLLILQLVMVTGGFVPPSHFHVDMHNTRVDVCGFGEAPILIHRLPEGKPVYGVQPNGDEIYIIRELSLCIEVFDRRTFELKRYICSGNLKGAYDMVQSRSDPPSAYLFTANWFNAVNLTVNKVPYGTETQWSFQESGPTTLGLAGSNLYTGKNILVTASASQKVKEFTPNGSLVNEFTFHNISSPRQSIKVASDRYAVCRGYGPPPALHQVCLVDEDGETINCYGGVRGSGVGQLNIPGRLELNKKNCILVADTGNKRVVLLDQNLKYVRNLINEDLEGPYRLFLDQEQSLLYVADNTVDSSGIAVSGRVKVFLIEQV